MSPCTTLHDGSNLKCFFNFCPQCFWRSRSKALGDYYSCMRLALFIIGISIALGALIALPFSLRVKAQGGIQAGAIFLAVAVMFGLGVIFLALVI